MLSSPTLHNLLPWIQVGLWTTLLIGLIWRKRTGRWRRPHTFKWAIGLMATALAMAATAAVLQLYGK